MKEPMEMLYPTLSTYRNGNIAALWRIETSALIASDAKLSPLRAGDIVAAQIAYRAGAEYSALEQDIKEETISDERINLYDWLADNYNIKSDLIALSGTRTLIADMPAE